MVKGTVPAGQCLSVTITLVYSLYQNKGACHVRSRSGRSEFCLTEGSSVSRPKLVIQ